MIKGNIIKFGYGDILVGCYCNVDDDWDKFNLHLTSIKPPQEIGESVIGKEYDILEDLFISANSEEIFRLRGILSEIFQSSSKVINFKNYVLDFTEYNKKSVDVVIRATDQAIQMYMRPLAC